MWDAVRRLGYRNGLALESSMGSGNFLGLMPDDLNARFIGVEYDSITARIASALYPQATVLHSGFQDVPLPDGTFDLNIGNPPFGSESLRFQFKPELRGLSIHNQFFLASLDALKPGGLQVQVVSSFLMDAQDKAARQMLADKADLIAAFRLPDTAFKENARTEVVTDILILRKRASPLPRDKDDKGRELPPDYPEWVNTATVPDPLGGDAIPVNTYFKANPDHIIGTMDRSGKMRAAGMMNVHLDDPSTLGARLNALLSKVPQNVVNQAADVAERTEQAYTLLGEAMRIAVAREEPGHMAISADGKLTRVIEREHGEGTILQRQEITADSPWSAQLFVDAQGRWYKVEVQVDADGKPVKMADSSGAPTRFNAYTRTAYATEADVPSTLRLGKLGFERMTQLVKIRDLLKNQLVLETEDAPKAMMEGNRAKLAEAYKAYVDQHGPVNRRATAALVSDMPDGGLLLALESSYEPERTAEQAKRTGLPQQGEIAQPAAILRERVVPKYEPPTKAETPADALAITLAERGVVDIEHIAKLLGKSPEDAAAALTEGDKPLVFKDPELNTYETADAYLSGQVTRKLMAAQAAGLTQNVKALEAVQPERWGAENVNVQVGAAWVPPAVYADFAQHLMGGRATASFSPLTNTFSVAVSGAEAAKADQWGTEDMTGVAILERLLNSHTPTVTRRDRDGTYVDKEATTLAILKGREIASEFADWIFKDGDRREQLVELFNQKFNTRVSRQYDGSHLKLPGKVPDAMIQMRRHQKNAIWRGISSKFLLIDHVVGAGKTFTAIARAMERRRMGLAQKPAVVVPNHLVEQWQADVYRLYPGAKVLAATKKDFEKKNRRRLLSRVATGDYDIVILPHSSFGFVGISPETELRYLEEDLQQAIQAVADAQAQAEEDGDSGWRKPLGVKEAERLVTNIENRMAKLREGARDRLLAFEQLGIDDLTIDEAHEFKNLFYSSRLTKVRGMGDKVGSRKAADLYNKVRVVRDSNGAVVFMTGTPVSNSVVELYTMMRYLAAPELKELGMEHFDAWRSQFVDATPAFEPNESGRLQEVTRLGRSWSNMRSLMDLYYSFTDAVTIDDIKQWYAEDNAGKSFPVPNVKGGDRQLRKVAPTPAQETVLQQVIAGFDGLEGIQDQKERNATRLRLMDRARKLSLDVRAVDPRAQSKEEGGKLEQLSAEVKRIYDKWTPDRGTQLVFLDRSVPKAKGDDKIIKEYDAIVARRDKALKDDDEVAFQEANEALERYDADEIRELRSAQAGGWNAYQQIKDNLVALGIPPAEIRFVQEANTDEQKQALFDAVNGGKVRVLIGSTPRMGAGTNVQKRLVALHHADVTWKPSDIEQREGRIIRQGNDLLAKYGEKFEVEILAYATERTVDAKMWSLNATKLRAINGLRKYTGDFTMEVEDSESVSMAEMAALASGNPLLLERVTLESEISNLELQEKSHRRKRYGIEDALTRAKRVVDTYPGYIESTRARAAEMRRKVDALRATAEKRSVVVEGKTYTEFKPAMKAALDAVERQQAGNEKARYAITINGARVTSKDAIDTAIGQAIGDHETFEVDINGATYTQRTAGGRAAAEILSPRAADALERPVSGTLGSMMGMDLMYQIKARTNSKLVNIEVWLEDAGETVASVDINNHDPFLKVTTGSMRDALGLLAARVENAADTGNVTRLEGELARAKRDIPELEPKLNEPFAKAQELTDKRARLSEVVRQLTVNPPQVVAAPQADAPAPRAEPSGPVYFRSMSGSLKHEPAGKRVDLTEMPDGQFFIAPSASRRGEFEVMEVTTGQRVGAGKSRNAAIEDANAILAANRTHIESALKERAIPKDKLEAAIAQVMSSGRASFAKSGEVPSDQRLVLAAWQKLARTGGLFQFKTSQAKDFTGILKDVAPDITMIADDGDSATVKVQPQKTPTGDVARDPSVTLVRVEYSRTSGGVIAAPTEIGRGRLVGYTEDGKEAYAEDVQSRADIERELGKEVAARLLDQPGQAGRSAGLNTHVRTVDGVEVHPLGKPKAVTMTVLDGELSMDASQLKAGVHRGSALYAVALNYAYNNGVVFVPDPAGVSDDAMIRRTEHMLASALKTGTTRHMLPHKAQGMDWRVGDDQHNVLELIRASADNVMDAVPELKAVDYDWNTGQFVAADGRPVTRDDFRALADSPSARAARAGVSTLRRGVVSRSLERRAGTPAWRGVVTRLLQLGRAGLRGSQLEGLMYGRGATGARGMTVEALNGIFAPALKQLAADRRLDVQVVATHADLPQSIRDQDDFDDTVQAAFQGRTAYFVASAIRDRAQAHRLFAHEVVGHYGMEGLLGPALFAELKRQILSLRDRGKWADVFSEVSRRYERNADGTFRPLDDDTFAAETIAVFAERNILTSILQRAMAAVRAFLRRFFPDMEISKAELRQLLWEAGQRLEGRPYRPSAERVLGAGRASSMRQAVERYSFGRNDIRQAPPSEGLGASGVRAAFAKAPSTLSRLQELIKPDDRSLLDRIKDRLQDWRPAALGALQLRHLGELAEDTLPPVAQYADVVQRMATMRNELQERGHGIVEAGMKYQGAHGEEAKRLFRMLHDATLAGVDPAEAHQPLRMLGADYRTNVEVTEKSVREFVRTMKGQAKLNAGSASVYISRAKEARQLLQQERKRAQSHRQMAPAFAQLSPEAKALWVQMRDAYRAQSAEYEQALISRIEALDFDKAKKATQIARMRLQFESARVPFYVPLARWGEYWVSGTAPDGTREFYMQERASDQRRVRAELESRGYTAIGAGVKIDTARAQDGATAGFMAEMDQMLQDAGAPEKVRDEAFQLYLRTLPDLSIRKNFLHRQGTPGYSQDAIRALAGHIFHGSFQIARMRYTHELDALRREAEQIARNMATMGDPAANGAGAVVNELKKRHEWVLNPTDNGLVNKISSLGFVYYLGLTPAAALVNLLQTPMVAFPVLAARHDAGRVARELWRAMRESLGSYGHMERKLEGDELLAHQEFARRGVFDKTQAHNLAGVSESDTHAYSPGWHKVMTVISHVFHKAEVVNREATAMAAYRLARADGAGHAEAIHQADRDVHESQFDYSNANRARWMQSSAAKVLLMFRQYSLAVTWLIGRAFYQAIKGADPETRTMARRKLTGILGMTALFSGTLGLPVLGSVGAILNALAAAFGDDDEPWDWETELRAFLREMLGDTGAEAILRGPVQALTGVAIAQRVGISDLWFREPDRELEGRAWANYLFEQAAGPMGGLVTNFFRGQQLMAEGHVWRGVETIMPKAIKDAMKSVRYVTDGVNNLRGDAIVEDLNVFESLAQIAGFSPASVAAAYDYQRDIKGYEQYILDRRRALMDAFALAYRLGDIEGRDAVLAKMREFSAAYPALAITADGIRRSLMSRARYSQQADAGIIVDRRLRAGLEDRLGAG